VASYSLTAADNLIVGTSGDDTVSGTAATLNAGDSLAGDDGLDVLALFGSGTFHIDELATFTGFESITLNNFSTGGAYLYLGNQAISVTAVGSGSNIVYLGSGQTTIHGNGDGGSQVRSFASTSWNTDNVIDAITTVYLHDANYNFTTNTLTNIGTVYVLAPNSTIMINSASAAGIATFLGEGSNSQLVTTDTALDLSDTTVARLSVMSANSAGTTFTVSDIDTAFQIAGGPGHDTLVAQEFTFTASQRSNIFALASIESILDATGYYSDTPTTTNTTAMDDAYVILQGQSLTLSGSVGVLANDECSPPAIAALLTKPFHGTLELAADGGLTYVPTPGFTGVDAFTYGTLDGPGADTAEAQIYVVPISSGATTTLNLVGLTAEEQIAATYVAFFGRGADTDGFAFWVDQFEKGLPKGPTRLFSNIADSFGVGSEAKELYPFLANPQEANDSTIGDFLNGVYDNLFNRSPDTEGLAYWTEQIKQGMAAGQFVGSVLVNIMSGAQNTASGQDITTLMSKVAVSLEYVEKQQALGTEWTWADDQAEAMALLDPVTDNPHSVLIGIVQANTLVTADTI